ncbi:TadE/TadG family type IV pilus assembly protein [Streptomyces sp. RKND-216]|uniref:TadE/TadG family type IV pilus assembly protein n=1 Tax=Streptomyces sp. RKND-216 TaxID=2562581 RepID=UPI001FFB3ABD|nr:TadE/TadG family type IV pilus assembly protein [Streptomyces sp. RKND-216]
MRPATRPATARHTACRRDRQRGASSIEFAGMLPLLLLVALAALQLGIAGYAVQQAGTGARAGARTAAQAEIADRCAGTGKAAMSGWTARRSTFDCAHGGDAVTVTATVTIPSVIPGIDDFGSAARSVTMPSDEGSTE